MRPSTAASDWIAVAKLAPPLESDHARFSPRSSYTARPICRQRDTSPMISPAYLQMEICFSLSLPFAGTFVKRSHDALMNRSPAAGRRAARAAWQWRALSPPDQRAGFRPYIRAPATDIPADEAAGRAAGYSAEAPAPYAQAASQPPGGVQQGVARQRRHRFARKKTVWQEIRPW